MPNTSSFRRGSSGGCLGRALLVALVWGLLVLVGWWLIDLVRH